MAQTSSSFIDLERSAKFGFTISSYLAFRPGTLGDSSSKTPKILLK